MGDLFFRCAEPESILKRLRGKKRLIVGNHDGSWMEKIDLNRYFISVDHLLEISDGGHALTLQLVTFEELLENNRKFKAEH